jgi:hypothetical protein
LDVDYQDLYQVDWESDGVYLQINDEDVLKIRQYFFTAPLNEKNFQLAKKIYPLSRKFQHTYLADVLAITQPNTSTDLQNPGSILSVTFGDFFKRYALKATIEKPSISVVKKSKKKKVEPKQPARIKKTRKKRKTNDGTEFLQAARKQPDEANTLIERINKKATASPKKINKNFL